MLPGEFPLTIVVCELPSSLSRARSYRAHDLSKKTLILQTLLILGGKVKFRYFINQSQVLLAVQRPELNKLIR